MIPGTLQMIVNGKIELSRNVVSQGYIEKASREWKEKMLPVLTTADSWEIVLRVFSDWNKY